MVNPVQPILVNVKKRKDAANHGLATIINKRPGEVYVNYNLHDKRWDEWVSEKDIEYIVTDTAEQQVSVPGRKRKRKVGQLTEDDNLSRHGALTEEQLNIQQQKRVTQTRNFDRVHFGDWSIKTWYFSPYPKGTGDMDDIPTQSSASQHRGGSRGRSTDLHMSGTYSHADGATLFVCERCFKYMTDGKSWDLHLKCCDRKHPPGRVVYSRGAHFIWEVDGAKETLYCQNLALFGKLFIDIKTLWFDLDNFLFYLVTNCDRSDVHTVHGFFSKEKVSFDDYNLACITTFPPFQRQAFGMLMIEFSYELSRRLGRPGGTPERPLSDLGLRSYLAYWVATLVRFFRRVLAVVPQGSGSDVLFVSLDPAPPTLEADETSSAVGGKVKRKPPGRVDHNPVPIAALSVLDDPIVKQKRRVQQVANPDGSATTHVVMDWSIVDLAAATNLRLEDAIFAMNECGLMQTKYLDDQGLNETIIITREQVERVATERNVKRAVIDLAFVRLDEDTVPPSTTVVD